MVALLNSSAKLLRQERRFAPIAGLSSPERAHLIWDLHRVLVDPRAEVMTAKRAKAQLLRAVTAPDRFLPIIVPPLRRRDRVGGIVSENPITEPSSRTERDDQPSQPISAPQENRKEYVR